MNQKKYSKNTLMSEIMKNPKAPEILGKYNFPCLTCPMFSAEMNQMTLGQVCKHYKINSEEIIEKLNQK